MVDSVRTQVNAWLERGLESYYPVVFVDCVHIKIHRKRSVSNEAFYVALAVTDEGRREVLGISRSRSERNSAPRVSYSEKRLAKESI